MHSAVTREKGIMLPTYLAQGDGETQAVFIERATSHFEALSANFVAENYTASLRWIPVESLRDDVHVGPLLAQGILILGARTHVAKIDIVPCRPREGRRVVDPYFMRVTAG